jgi:hypothetical protein
MPRSSPRVPSTVFLVIVVVLALSVGCSRSGSPTSPEASGLPPVIATIIDITETVLEVTEGSVGTENWAGQSFTIPGTGRYDNLRFNWYHYNPRGESVAFGTAYLLTEEYLGIPGHLGESTPGFVARSERISDGQYIFPPSATVTGGTKYWIYTDGRGRFTSSFNTDIYPGGDMYVTGYHLLAFRKSVASWLRLPSGEYLIPEPGTFIDANFRLQGAAR